MILLSILRGLYIALHGHTRRDSVSAKLMWLRVVLMLTVQPLNVPTPPEETAITRSLRRHVPLRNRAPRYLALLSI